VIYIGVGHGHGTGFQILNKNKKIIITNEHVCAKSADNTVAISTTMFLPFWMPKTIIAVDKDHDLCAIEGSTHLDTFKLAPTLKPWQTVHYYGFPLNLGLALYTAQTQNYLVDSDYQVVLNNIAIPGQSGSPVLNENEEVIGVIKALIPGQFEQNRGTFVALEKLKDFIATLK